MELKNGIEYFITNKQYDHANLAQWGTGGREMGTYEQKINDDQIWRLEESAKHKGYYYIHNANHEGYRVAKWGNANGDVGIYSGQFCDDQLWRFDHMGNEYYRVYNFSHPKAKIAKWGKGDGDWGTYEGGDADDQLWKLTPRFMAEFNDDIVWACDNRSGTEPFEEKVSVTVGLKIGSSSTVTTTTGLEATLTEACAPCPGVSTEMSATVRSEITTSMSNSEQASWSSTHEIVFSAPAGYNYRVRQLGCDFISEMPNSKMQCKCDWRIEQTKGEFPN